jgi:hypothetical protein
MSLNSRIANVARAIEESRPHRYVPVYDDDILRDFPEYDVFLRRISVLDRLRMEAQPADSERYRQAEFRAMAEFDAWRDRTLDRVMPEILRTRWPDDDVIFVRHSYSEPKGADRCGP